MPGTKGTHTLFCFLGICTTPLIAAGIETRAGEWTCLRWHHEQLAEAGAQTLSARGPQQLLRATPEQPWAQHPDLSLTNTHPSTAVPPVCPDLRTLVPVPCRLGAVVGCWSSASSGGDTSALISDSRKATAGLTGHPHPNALEWRHLLWAVISTDSPKVGCHSQPPDS